MILNGSIPYKNAVRSICEYLSGFYYEKEILKLNNEEVDDIEDDVQLLISSGETEFQKTDFHNKAGLPIHQFLKDQFPITKDLA